MDDQSNRRSALEPAAPLWVTSFLLVLAVLLILMTTVAVFVQVFAYTKQSTPIEPAQIVGLVAAFIGGLAGAALMLAIARMLKYWHLSARSLARVENIGRHLADNLQAARPAPTQAKPTPQPVPPVAPTASTGLDYQALQSILTLLTDIRDNSLLSEEQRRTKLERIIAEHRRGQIDQFQSMMGQGKFHRAEHILEELIRRFGNDEELDRLAGRLVQARADLEKQHVQQAHARINDLLSVNAWDRAEQVATDLLQHHPDSEDARKLADRVQTEKVRVQGEQKTRLFAEIEKNTLGREWHAALKTAKLLVRLYPDSPEAETLKPRLETLEANAEIATRQALEARIKDLIKLQRYAEAAEIAEQIMRDYPASPQADALRDQLPRLRELAAGVSQSPASP